MNRRWTIRTRILTLLLAPLIPLLAMLIFATAVMLGPAINLRNARTSVDAAGVPAAAVVSDLQVERELSVITVSLRVPNQNATSGLTASRGQTDEAAAELASLSSNTVFLSAANPKTLTYLALLRTQLQKLTAERAAIDDHLSRASVMSFYNGLIQTAFNMYASIANLDDHVLQAEADSVVGMAQATEFFAREDALVAGPLAAGVETSTDYTQLVATISTKRYLFQQAIRYLSAADAAAYRKITSSPAYSSLTKMESQLVTKPTIGASPDINAATWRSNVSEISGNLASFENTIAFRVIDKTGTAAAYQQWRLGIAAGVILLMIVVVLIFSLRVARVLIRRVAGLRMDALSLALDRLPSAIARLRRGEVVDLAAETPPLRYGTDELGQLGEAFTRVQETAVTSAIQEANLRHGLNQVFLNIARRSQTLLHRQLALLDWIERRTEDPDQLEELFRIDHLATRMRRHAEDLVILAGATPGRGWRHPIPFADVLRAAASEVEEYARISVVGVPDVDLAGRAVNDVVHMLAELLENATMFSPPDTQVLLSGQTVPNGFVIEIEDRGLGMSASAIIEANARLASPPDFDPTNSSRLGLFVVARLAAKHGIRVELRRSPYGGVTAVALVPSELVVSPSDEVSAMHGFGNGRRTNRMPADDDTAERPVSGGMMTAVAVLEDRSADAIGLTSDGLPKRSRQASVPRHAIEARHAIESGDSALNGTASAAIAGGSNSGFFGSGADYRSDNGYRLDNGNRSDNGDRAEPDPGELPQRQSYHSRNGLAGLDDTMASDPIHTGGTSPSRALPPGPSSSDSADPGSVPAPRTSAESAGGNSVYDTGGTPAAPRTPEQMRSMLSSFQDGLALGRRDAAGLPRPADDVDAPSASDEKAETATMANGSLSTETHEERHPE